MVFVGCGFTSGGQKSVSVFSAAVCKIQASKRYIKSLPLVLKDKRSCFSQSEKSAALDALSLCMDISCYIVQLHIIIVSFFLKTSPLDTAVECFK